ncbi:hypothetical protein I3843_03G190800 [Carya illinoinensis]|nr:hypothetical protein I3843_03G190800 [Carya illinoinensis]
MTAFVLLSFERVNFCHLIHRVAVDICRRAPPIPAPSHLSHGATGFLLFLGLRVLRINKGRFTFCFCSISYRGLYNPTTGVKHGLLCDMMFWTGALHA